MARKTKLALRTLGK